MNTPPNYFLGHADLEIERLQLQAIIGNITRRLISEAGIKPGMPQGNPGEVGRVP